MAVWLTDSAQKKLDARDKGGPVVPHEGPAPDWDCSCGSYFYRTMDDAWVTDYNVYAHVTCLGRTMLHTAGGRTTQYSVDYFISPEDDRQKVYQMNPMLSSPFGSYSPMVESDKSMLETMTDIGQTLGIPVLGREDLQGCPVCLEVNGWRKSEEITAKMKRDWFGEGYRG